MCGKSNRETYITICKIDSQQEFAVWLRKLKQGMEREIGVSLKKKGIYVYLWLIHVEVWQKTAKLCKAIILQKKKKNSVQKTKKKNNLKKNDLAIQGFLCFHTNCKTHCANSEKNAIGNLYFICTLLWIVSSFSQYWSLQYKNIVYVSIYHVMQWSDSWAYTQSKP